MEPNTQQALCSVCDRNMTDSQGRTIIGVSISLGSNFPGRAEGDPGLSEIYPEIEQNKIYNICFVCWLRSLGVKVGDTVVPSAR